jgi:cell division ATPase FtsA
MFDDSNIIVGLEIGTSKICAVVGEQNADGALNIIGLGQSRSRGVRKGEIADAPRPRKTCATPSSRPSRWPTWKSAAFISA